MSERIKHQWTVTIADENGLTTEQTVHAFWDPEHTLTPNSVATAAAAEAGAKTGSKFFPVSEPVLVR